MDMMEAGTWRECGGEWGHGVWWEIGERMPGDSLTPLTHVHGKFGDSSTQGTGNSETRK